MPLKPGPTPKAPSERHGHHRGPELALVATDPGAIAAIPDPPTGLLAATRARWCSYWESRISQAANAKADGFRLERWIRDVDEWYRCGAAFRRRRMVTGSTGQPVLNPLASYISELERRIAAAETEFGMTPQARARLGLHIGEARLTAVALEEKLKERRADRDPDEDRSWAGDWQEA
jgi:P27 family predicted phage terminase small subunit